MKSSDELTANYLHYEKRCRSFSFDVKNVWNEFSSFDLNRDDEVIGFSSRRCSSNKYYKFKGIRRRGRERGRDCLMRDWMSINMSYVDQIKINILFLRWLPFIHAVVVLLSCSASTQRRRLHVEHILQDTHRTNQLSHVWPQSTYYRLSIADTNENDYFIKDFRSQNYCLSLAHRCSNIIDVRRYRHAIQTTYSNTASTTIYPLTSCGHSFVSLNCVS